MDAFMQGEELHGWAIMKQVDRSGPTVYGVIDRLEDAGLIAGRWEAQNPQPNKPRRRFYQLNPEGLVLARKLLNERRPDRLRKLTTRHIATEPRPRVAGGEP
ncbi:MAG TPA: PadR family transcriptional regulator [Actinophytocola sp.]|uniref:PadR family transcriptional regulator n=1 Tax=Actinophytocola sp. TaxID=1872138 RepID=UPI002DBF9109|nr:PadR family transcriptional regulator [Actinophytocola sp.]HEU5472737.1 PadR family transcriptional regulator [Actinophytocola sp.]